VAARVLTVELEAVPASAAKARRAVAGLLREHGTSGDANDFALLVASELVTNAICHGRGPIELRAEVTDDAVRVEVGDRGAPLGGDVQYPDPWATTGRGLAIVEAVSREWGVEWREGGKTVWAELDPGTAG
jgi:anti-sigma regulatory factor (Ser/Thr protein kinase)